LMITENGIMSYAWGSQLSVHSGRVIVSIVTNV
jgi:hypothetical protein